METAVLFRLKSIPVLRTITFGFSILNLLVKTNLTNGQCSQNCTQPWFQTSYQFFHHQTLSLCGCMVIPSMIDLIFGVLTSLSAIFQRPVLVVEEAGENHRPWASNK
jgi:hypothetical protein